MLDEKGKVLLISEGYPELKSRETGLQSVLKNRAIRERYTIVQQGGEFFLSLRAGNRKEIARSCGFKTEAAVMDLLLYLTAAKKEVSLTTKAEKETVKKTATIKKTVSETKKTEPTTVVEANATKTTKIAKIEVELPIEAFYGHENIWNEYGITGYAKFQGSNGKFYFVVYNPDGSIYLRSEGFATEGARDKGLETVVNNIEIADNYRVTETGGVFYSVLTDTQGTEIARSASYCTFTDAFVTTPRGREEVVVANLY
jgi:uncharacterized protein YegP (UPF0339 family)